MKTGDTVQVKYIYNERVSKLRNGVVEYVSQFGWASIRFQPGNYLESFWNDKILNLIKG